MSEQTVEHQGRVLRLSSCETEVSKNISSFSLGCDQVSVSSCSAVVVKQDDLSHCPNAASARASIKSDDDILTNWWRPSDYDEQTKQIFSGQCSSRGAACNPRDSVSSSSSSSQSSETGSVTDLMEPGKDVEDDDAYEKLDLSTVESSYEQLDHCIELPVSEEHQCRKMSFPDEKLQLIYKLILSRGLEFVAEVSVKLDKHVVKISGTVEDIEHTEMKLRELVVSFTTAGVCISETGAKLLSTKVGEDWLDARLASEQLLAVFHVTDSLPMITTNCQDKLTSIKRIIESSLVIRHRQLEQHHTKLLQSAVWNKCIENLQSEHLVRISVDYGADMRLVVEGCVDGTKVALDKLGEMLGENSRISHSLKLRSGVYRVLSFRKHEIQQEAKYVVCCLASKLQISFIEQSLKNEICHCCGLALSQK